jgi:hypothetical protein
MNRNIYGKIKYLASRAESRVQVVSDLSTGSLRLK